jgi:catechol 2,3-dioxygenase-like lactoylglutathione lyase family enzyme
MAAISPFFIVRNLQETIAFYRDNLGFETTFEGGDPEPFFAILRRDGVQVMIKEIGDGIEPQPNPGRHEWARWDAFVYTADPEGLAVELNARFAKEVAKSKDWDDGLTGFEIADPNGYVFFFGKPSSE